MRKRMVSWLVVLAIGAAPWIASAKDVAKKTDAATPAKTTPATGTAKARGTAKGKVAAPATPPESATLGDKGEGARESGKAGKTAKGPQVRAIASAPGTVDGWKRIHQELTAPAGKGCTYSLVVHGDVHVQGIHGGPSTAYSPSVDVTATLKCPKQSDVTAESRVKALRLTKEDFEAALRGQASVPTKDCYYVPDLKLDVPTVAMSKVAYLCPTPTAIGGGPKAKSFGSTAPAKKK
jgi:hypothetical protein